jgi:hypothetical protein
MKFAEMQHIVERMGVVLVCLIFYSPTMRAQESRQQLTAPPPMKAIAREERSQIDEAKDAKARVRTAIDLAEEHLIKAEAHTSQHEYEAASAELGKYWALIEDDLSFLTPMSHDSNKTRDLYKRLELALRAHGPRLTSMRRTTPLEYAVWIKEVEDFARKSRTDALNSFYGHTVVRDGQQKPVNERPSEQSKDGSIVPKTKQQ